MLECSKRIRPRDCKKHAQPFDLRDKRRRTTPSQRFVGVERHVALSPHVTPPSGRPKQTQGRATPASILFGFPRRSRRLERETEQSCNVHLVVPSRRPRSLARVRDDGAEQRIHNSPSADSVTTMLTRSLAGGRRAPEGGGPGPRSGPPRDLDSDSPRDCAGDLLGTPRKGWPGLGPELRRPPGLPARGGGPQGGDRPRVAPRAPRPDARRAIWGPKETAVREDHHYQER
jgi:hypothetical protein